MTVTHPSSRSRRRSRIRGAGVALPEQVEHDQQGVLEDSRGVLGSPFLLGILAGVQAVVLGLAVVIVSVILLWLLTPGGSGLLDAVRTGVVTWLVGHRTGLSTGTGFVRMAPLGLTLLLGACAWFFARRAGRALAFAGATDQSASRAHTGFVVAYLILGSTLTLISPSVQVRPELETAVPGLLIVATLASASPLWQHRIVSSWRRPASRRGAWVHTGLSALGFPAAVALLLIVGCVVVGFSRVSSLFDALHPGAAGSIGLALVHVAVLPNVVMWLLSWLAGPGFWVGLGTTVSSTQTVLGPLPALPLLGILPAPGHHPVWVRAAAALVVVLGGVLAGRSLARWQDTEGTTGLARWVDVLAAAGVTGIAAALLSWWSSGPLGGGVMAWWGIAAWWFPVIMAVQAGVGIALGMLLSPLLRRGRRTREQSV